MVIQRQEFTEPHPADRSHSRQALAGVSALELLIVIVIVLSLGAIAIVAYQGYVKSVNTKLGAVQKLTIEDRVERDLNLILNGADSGLRKPGTNEPITTGSTCREFLDAMRPRLAHYRNPFDGSPAVTFWSGYSFEQDQGKLRITCYRFHGADVDNGGSCRLDRAGIRMTYFRIPCGGHCGAPHCVYPKADCGGAKETGWVHLGQVEKFIGTIEHKYVRLPNGRRARFPNGDLMIDPTYSRQVCPGYNYGRIAKEADY